MPARGPRSCLRRLIRHFQSTIAMTRVFIVGAGPGSADLITLRGARALERATVVLHDALVDPALRAMSQHAEWVDVGKRGFCDSTAQTRINALLVHHARQDGAVV